MPAYLFLLRPWLFGSLPFDIWYSRTMATHSQCQCWAHLSQLSSWYLHAQEKVKFLSGLVAAHFIAHI